MLDFLTCWGSFGRDIGVTPGLKSHLFSGWMMERETKNFFFTLCWSKLVFMIILSLVMAFYTKDWTLLKQSRAHVSLLLPQWTE